MGASHLVSGRRSFLKTTGLAVASLAALPGRILADPYAPAPRFPLAPRSPLRIRGRVTGAGRGLSGVPVSDGLAVTATDRDGRFELVSTDDRDFVRCSVPSGYRIPTHPTGTAQFYQSILPERGGEMAVAFDLEPLPAPDDSHTMLFLPDVQVEDATEMGWFHQQSVPDVQATVRALGDQDVFGVAGGDIMYDHLELYPEYERGVQRMGIPFFQVVGNHDLDQDNLVDEASTATFTSHFGPRYYSFDRGAVHYVVLDDVFWHGAGYIGYLPQDQLRWLEADLARVEPGRPVIVALHIPVLGSRHVRLGERSPDITVSVTNRERLYRMLEPFQAHIVCGHTHENDHVLEHGVHEHVSGTVCGAWWSGPICGDGTPSGYSVYEVSGEEIRWRYKSTGLPDDHQIRISRPGSDPAAPTEAVANVWDADPDWTVVWYADGERRGAMARRIGHDPLSLEIHSGPDLPPRRTWVEPLPVRHLFYAPVTPGTRELRVEATDRFGRVYSERMEL